LRKQSLPCVALPVVSLTQSLRLAGASQATQAQTSPRQSQTRMLEISVLEYTPAAISFLAAVGYALASHRDSR
jgi:hypothetical protein